MPMANLYAYMLERKLVTQCFPGPEKALYHLVLIRPRSVNTILGLRGILWKNVTI